jgi:hypothetical protein
MDLRRLCAAAQPAAGLVKHRLPQSRSRLVCSRRRRACRFDPVQPLTGWPLAVDQMHIGSCCWSHDLRTARGAARARPITRLTRALSCGQWRLRSRSMAPHWVRSAGTPPEEIEESVQ